MKIQSINNIWLSISLKKKIFIFSFCVIMAIAISIIFNYIIVEYSVGDFNIILHDNALCGEFQEAYYKEKEAFNQCIRNKDEESIKNLEEAIFKVKNAIEDLPFDYARIGKLRYSKTWNIKNSYNKYAELRDFTLKLNEEDARYIENIYKVYSMQGYIEGYANNLMLDTMNDGRYRYIQKADVFKKIPKYFFSIALIIVFAIIYLSTAINKAIIYPVEKMATISKNISNNNFSDSDIFIDNKDEIGDLAYAFNKMKRATVDYINSLEDKYRVTELLHKEEVKRVEIEKNLHQIGLELLKSQINPHFLFNTLNIIACSARLEEAMTTERMITSLSNIFRYNLKPMDQIVPVSQELRIISDYMYIQNMRFGDRIRYISNFKVNENLVKIPSFTLQPLVENAIIHGLSKKEEGGIVAIKIYKKEETAVIKIIDTGIGMDKDKLEKLRQFTRDFNSEDIGIGFGNICRRIRTMYKNSRIEIFSKKNKGTIIVLNIPQNEYREE